MCLRASRSGDPGRGSSWGRGLLTGRAGKAADGVVGGAAGPAGRGSWEQSSALGAGGKSSQAGGPSPAAQGWGLPYVAGTRGVCRCQNHLSAHPQEDKVAPRPWQRGLAGGGSCTLAPAGPLEVLSPTGPGLRQPGQHWPEPGRGGCGRWWGQLWGDGPRRGALDSPATS